MFGGSPKIADVQSAAKRVVGAHLVCSEGRPCRIQVHVKDNKLDGSVSIDFIDIDNDNDIMQ